MKNNYILGYEKLDYINKDGKEIKGYILHYTYKSKKENIKGFISDKIYLKEDNKYNKKIIDKLNTIDNFPIGCDLYLKKSNFEDFKFYLVGLNL